MQAFLKFIKNRMVILITFTCVLAGLLVVKLVDLQIVHGEYYTALSDRRMYKTVTTKAPRGEITDRYGKALASNKTAYSVMINYDFEDDSEINSVIESLIKVMDENEKIYDDTLPVSYNSPYTYRFEQMQSGTDEVKWKADMKYAADITAAEVIDDLIEKYEITEPHENEMIRRIAGVRYDMEKRNFSRKNPFLFMSDIDINLVSKIKENPDELSMVEIISEPVRQYPADGIAAHILGQVGIIYQEEYQQLADRGYGMNDILGKDGLEKYLEYYLRGKDGQESLDLTINGETVVFSESIPAQPGNRAVLTIDANMQAVAEKSLEKAVKTMAASGAHDIQGASAVAIEVNTGEVLAMANYPTYNPATFKKDYSKLLEDPLKPMFNRAVGGAYPPGSTFKPLTAIACLQEGIITKNELIDCNGPYKYYAPSYTPACWIYNDSRGRHGPINVVKALEVSCNIFFFDSSRRLGIEKLNEYGKKFGLGQLTGIEIVGETAGVLAGPEEREAGGGIWYPGDTIQAAIGQSDNLFTPLQMANYAATVANGGTRYAPHLVKNIVEPDGHKTIVSFEPKVLDTIDISKENLALVHQGMKQVVETTSKKSFDDALYTAAGKTGTAQTRKDRTPHSWFISFAPFENPQVAIAVVVEHGGINGLGIHVSRVAREMYDAYFYSSDTQTQNAKNSLLY